MKTDETILCQVLNLRQDSIGSTSASTTIPAKCYNTASSTGSMAPLMIATDAPILMCKAAEMIIKELTIRAWRYTKIDKKCTLMTQHVHNAVMESEVYDFLIDVISRTRTRTRTKEQDNNSKNNNSNDKNTAAAITLQLPPRPPAPPPALPPIPAVLSDEPPVSGAGIPVPSGSIVQYDPMLRQQKEQPRQKQQKEKNDQTSKAVLSSIGLQVSPPKKS